jgi:hypothetical protein
MLQINSPRPSNREADDNYHSVIAVFHGQWRVIICNQGIQWIFQRKAPGLRNGQPYWRDLGYFRRSRYLLQRINAECHQSGLCEPVGAALAALLALPSVLT